MNGAPVPNAGQAYLKAVDAFKINSGITPHDLRELQLTTLSDLRKAIHDIQSKQKASRKMLYVKRLDPFLQAMEQYGAVLNIFVNTSDFVAFIWGPVKLLLLMTSNFTDAFNALLDGYLQIGRNLPLLAQYQDLLKSNSYLQEALALMFEDILKFHAEAVKYFKQRTLKQVFQATWNGFNRKIEQLSDSLAHQKLFVESIVRLSQFKEIQELRQESQREFRQLQSDRVKSQAEFDKIHEEERDRRRIRIHQWLGAVNSDTIHEDICNRRHQGTGEWLLAKQEFQSWYSLNHCSDPLLWINGIPGAGKTVLSSFVIDKIRELPGATVAYFYCKYDDESRNGFLAVAKAVLAQILAQNDNLVNYFHDRVSISGQATLSSPKLSKELLEVVLKSQKNTYVVIDGLDECSRDDRKEIATWFQEIIRSIPTQSLGALRCLMVSQRDGFAKKDLSKLAEIKIEITDNREDIRSYSHYWHQQIEKKFGDLARPDHNITDVVTARAQGMFLYARLVLLNLYDQSTRMDLEQALDPNEFPVGISQAYDRILKRLLNSNQTPSSRQKNVKRLLGWLACAKRPLKWYEIQAAMSINTKEGTFNPDAQFVEDSKDLCASLVEVSSDNSITLVHSTARAYLIEEKHIDPPEIDCDLAILCLVYFSIPDLIDELSEDEIEESIMRGAYSFLDYAASFWGLHVESGLHSIGDVQGENQDRVELLNECLETFLDSHWSAPAKENAIRVSETLRNHLRLVGNVEVLDRASQSISALKSALRPSGKNALLEEMLLIYRVCNQVRRIFESIVSSKFLDDARKAIIERQYGPLWFKCNRLNCRYYHQGFRSETLRQQHIDKHDRSYTCTIEGCAHSIIGCTTALDLEKHMFNYHGIRRANENQQFPEDDQPKKGRAQPQAESRFACNLCEKRFTRKFNLEAHQRTHANDRPHRCSQCDKGFARKQDKNRHELTHEKKRKRDEAELEELEPEESDEEAIEAPKPRPLSRYLRKWTDFGSRAFSNDPYVSNYVDDEDSDRRIETDNHWRLVQ